MTGLDMESIFAKIKEEYARTDDVGKRQIQGHIRELQVGFYSDWDVVMRLSSGVGLPIFETLAMDGNGKVDHPVAPTSRSREGRH